MMPTPRTALLLALAAMVTGLVAIAALTPAAALRGLHADVGLYFDVAERLAQGEVPYRDFPSEYPPLALMPIAVARFFPSAQTVDLGLFAARLVVLNAALAAVGLLLVALLAADRHPSDWRRTAAGATYAALALLLGAVVAWRYDILPTVLSLGALVLLVSRRPGLSGVALGAAVAAKLYAAPLAVLFIGWHLARGERAEVARFSAGFLGVGIAMFAPLVVGGLDLSFVRYQLDRGLQIESVPAGIVGLAHLVGVHAESNVGFGSVQVESALSGPLFAAFGVLAPIVIGLVLLAGLLRLWGSPVSGARAVPTLAALVAATLLAVITTNKALSPQYLIWLLPFVPLLSAGPRLLMIAATVLTLIVFPILHTGLAALEPMPVVLLNVRNGLLAGTLAWLVIEQRPVLRGVTARRPAPPSRTVRGHAAADVVH